MKSHQLPIFLLFHILAVIQLVLQCTSLPLTHDTQNEFVNVNDHHDGQLLAHHTSRNKRAPPTHDYPSTIFNLRKSLENVTNCTETFNCVQVSKLHCVDEHETVQLNYWIPKNNTDAAFGCEFNFVVGIEKYQKLYGAELAIFKKFQSDSNKKHYVMFVAFKPAGPKNNNYLFLVNENQEPLRINAFDCNEWLTIKLDISLIRPYLREGLNRFTLLLIAFKENIYTRPGDVAVHLQCPEMRSDFVLDSTVNINDYLQQEEQVMITTTEKIVTTTTDVATTDAATTDEAALTTVEANTDVATTTTSPESEQNNQATMDKPGCVNAEDGEGKSMDKNETNELKAEDYVPVFTLFVNDTLYHTESAPPLSRRDITATLKQQQRLRESQEVKTLSEDREDKVNTLCKRIERYIKFEDIFPDARLNKIVFPSRDDIFDVGECINTSKDPNIVCKASKFGNLDTIEQVKDGNIQTLKAKHNKIIIQECTAERDDNNQ